MSRKQAAKSQSEQGAEQADSARSHFEVQPVRRNLPLLLISGVLLVVWLAYLAFVTWRTVF
jgi:hypothetical protein